jgi:hypothetical protein
MTVCLEKTSTAITGIPIIPAAEKSVFTLSSENWLTHHCHLPDAPLESPWMARGGSANNTHIGFEICEDGLTDYTYFQKVYREAVELCAYLCKEYGLTEQKHHLPL